MFSARRATAAPAWATKTSPPRPRPKSFFFFRFEALFTLYFQWEQNLALIKNSLLLDKKLTKPKKKQVEREPSGSTISGVVPSATFATSDGRWCVVGGNGDSVYSRLMSAVGRPEMDSTNPKFASNAARCEAADEIYGVIGKWVSQRTLEEVIAAMREARVPAGPILRARDLLEDEQFLARKMFERASPPPPASKRASSSPPGAEASSGESSLSFTLPAIVPVLSRTAGSTLWAGPELGAHTEEVLMEEGGFSKEEVEELRASGAVL